MILSVQVILVYVYCPTTFICMFITGKLLTKLLAFYNTMANNSSPEGKLRGLPPSAFTNQLVVQVLQQINKDFSWSAFADILNEKFSTNISIPTLRLSVNRCQQKYRKLQKNSKYKCVFNNFCTTQFNIPKGKPTLPTASVQVPATPTVPTLHVSRPNPRNEDVMLLKEKVFNLEQQLKKHQNEVEEYASTLGSVRGGKRRVQETIKRLQKSRNSWKKKCKKAQKKVKNKDTMISKLMMKLKCEQRKNYISRKQAHEGRKKIRVIKNTRLINKLQRELDELEQDIECRKRKRRKIPTKQGHSFTPEIRETSYYLQNIGVSEEKVSKAMEIVGTTLCNVEFSGPLPSRQTQSQFASEMKSLARQQVNEELGDEHNTTLKYDGTTKKRVGHLVECEVQSTKNCYLVGLKQQAGGSSSDYVNSIKQSMSEINPQVFKSVSNTMTDRAIVNNCIDRKLEEINETRLNSFRCGMHPLDTIGKACDKVLVIQEKDFSEHFNRLYKKKGESVVSCFIRKCCDLFHNQQTGCCTELTAFLKSAGCPIHTIPRWVGNRFNILFDCSTCILVMTPYIREYFTKVNKPTNDLQSVILQYILSPHIQTALHALATLGRVIAHPWMRMINDAASILDTNKSYQDAVNHFREWQLDPSDMLSPNTSAFHEYPSTSERCLPKPGTDIRTELLGLLSGMMEACIEVSTRQLESQLIGGRFWDPSMELAAESASCSSTNISGERQFGRADAMLHRAPNISVGKVESKLMFSSNDTASWLQKFPVDERENKIMNAMKMGKNVRLEEQKQKQSVVKLVQERNKMRRKELTEKEKKLRDKLENIIEEVIKEGLVRTADGLTVIKDKSVTKQKKMLTAQIRFYECVNNIKSKHALSKCCVDELKSILTQEIEKECMHPTVVEIMHNPEVILKKMFKQKWEEEESGVEKWWTGHIEKYNESEEEYSIIYDGQEETNYMTRAEVVCDLLSSDFIFI
nr:uncharacterized protein LOC129279140 [Lytechinus pictus]